MSEQKGLAAGTAQTTDHLETIVEQAQRGAAQFLVDKGYAKMTDAEILADVERGYVQGGAICV